MTAATPGDRPAAREVTVHDHSVPQSQTPMLQPRNRFKLALFCANTARGTTVSLDADPLVQVTWPESIRICQAADRAGIDAVIPLARWRNVPPLEPAFDRVFDSFTWAAAIAALTERIQVFATFHVPLYPPVMAAKMVATIDHISGGRFGLNVVAGFSASDFAMFGIELDPKADRYGPTEEWLSILKRAWQQDEPFDHDGPNYHGRSIVSQPKPVQTPWPVIMCAGNSPSGKAFSARHAEVNFGAFASVEAIPASVTENRRLAAEAGREVKVFGHGYVIVADTEAEARRRLEHFAKDRIDQATASAWVDATLGFSTSTRTIAEQMKRQTMVERAAAGYLALPLLGTPEQVAEGIAELADAGLDGMAISFPDYEEGIAAYASEVRPLLIQRGLRED
jgi:FMNH2-dependent dimethyl sulfone monooxygenase